MKAWYKIHDKPRGRWRPLMEFGVSFSREEWMQAEALNVNKELYYAIAPMDAEDSPQCHACGQAYGSGRRFSGRILLFLPERPFDANHKKVDYGYLSGCKCGRVGWRCFGSIQFTEGKGSWAFRLPWRPGSRPDYSDFINPVRDFLRQILEEMERRLQEALESAPSEEWLLEEEFDSFSRQTSDIEEERKLRVIRR